MKATGRPRNGPAVFDATAPDAARATGWRPGVVFLKGRDDAYLAHIRIDGQLVHCLNVRRRLSSGVTRPEPDCVWPAHRIDEIRWSSL